MNRMFAGEPINKPKLTCCSNEWGCEECNPSPKKEDLTCNGCTEVDTCKYAWDYYNTNGDCLAIK